MPVHAERFCDNVYFALAITEHDAAFNIVHLDKFAQRIAAGFHIIGRDLDDALCDRFSRLRRTSNFDADRVVLESLGELLNLFCKSRREQQRLALFGKQLTDHLDVIDKSHIEHTVGFINNQGFDTC